MASTSYATPSSSQSPPLKLNYEVFLSFRGEDVRKNFLEHLNFQLKLKGIHTFKDDDRLKIGDSIGPELLKAIKESRIAIVIFSKDYASSTWCLEEVATIMECKEEQRQIVVPIFFHVEPSHVRKQEGSFKDSFEKHEAKFSEDMVERWKKALTQAAGIKGHDLDAQYNGNELDCIQGVVDDIFTKLPPPPGVQENLVGIEQPLKDISKLMEVCCEDVKIIGLWGMGGIGKTTLARVVFDQFSSDFDGTCFLGDISQHALIDLQKKLLKKLLKESLIDIGDEYEGIWMIKKRLGSKRVLIVLDDLVDQHDKLEKLIGDGKWLCNGSRVIITTRDKHLFAKLGIAVGCHEVKGLNEEKGLELFSWHAFNKKSPDPEFEDLSRGFVRHASGLPLALKVWGSHLRGRADREMWEGTLQQIKHIPSDGIIEKLRISFDGLEENCKKVFLDIACFFRHENWGDVKDVLACCKLYPSANISVLIDRCLLFIDSLGYINMHDLIHEMGLKIAKSEIPRRRIWLLDDLDYEPKVVEGLEGVLLSFRNSSYDENISPNIEAFKQMAKLKMLIVEFYRYCSQSRMRFMDYLPKSLMVLKFQYYPWSKPFYSKDLKNLTYLDLRGSSSLLETPNFAMMPNLKIINLSGCENLKDIHSSVGNLKKLVVLDLSGCKNLEKIPSFNQVSSLESLYLEGCSKLKYFPKIKDMKNITYLNLKSLSSLLKTPNFVELPKLKTLYLSGCKKLKEIHPSIGSLKELELLHLKEVGIKELPSSIQQLRGLTKLCLDGCEHLVCLSTSLCVLKNLRTLEVTGCSKIGSLPENLKCLTSLVYLNLQGSGFVGLPESFSQLLHLQYLDIRNCEELKELPKLPANVWELYVDYVFMEKIAELATECSKLYSVSFSPSDEFAVALCLANEFIHFPFHRKTPFCISHHIIEQDEFGTIFLMASFRYRSYGSNRISINLNFPWFSENFVGFALCFLSPKLHNVWEPHSYQDMGDHIKHCAVRAKLSHKKNESEDLQTEIVFARPSIDLTEEGECFCFAYIPFSSLRSESKTKRDGVALDDYTRFEVEFVYEFERFGSANWGCSLLYKSEEELPSWDESLPGCTTDIGPFTKWEYLNLSGKFLEHLPHEVISRLGCLQYLDISGCPLLKELPELPANIRELYAHYSLASESNIAELATKYSELYSVSFFDERYLFRSTEELAKKFIHSHSITEPFLNRNTPFVVTYLTHTADIRTYHSLKIPVDLNPSWYRQSFVGFAVCFSISDTNVRKRWTSDPEIRPFMYFEVIAKLTQKDNENEVLQTKCMSGRLYDEEHLHRSTKWFVYIPFSNLWPESKIITDDITPNHYSAFEIEFPGLDMSTDCSCSLLYTDDEMPLKSTDQPPQRGLVVILDHELKMKLLIDKMREQEEAGSHGRVPTQAELDDMFVEEIKRRIDLAFGSDSQSELGESDDESESQLIEHGVAEAEMAEYSTDVQTIEERGIRFRTCIASFIWLRQKLATMCTGSADSNDSGEEIKDEEMGSLDIEEVQEYEEEEEEEEEETFDHQIEQRKKAFLDKGKAPAISSSP